MAVTGAQSAGHILEDAIASGRLTEAQIFDTDYQAIPSTDPPKYHTAYDAFTNVNFQAIEDAYLADADTVYAVVEDLNGYLPTHNRHYSQPLTGNYSADLTGNRTKRLFNDPTGLAAAQNTQPGLQQVYYRDTGEVLWDISAPIRVNGRHWGAFRIGFSPVRVEAQLASVTWRSMAVAVVLALILAAAASLVLWPMRRVRGVSALANRMAGGDVDQDVPLTLSQSTLITKYERQAQAGAQAIACQLEAALAAGQLTETQAFDTDYQLVPNTKPLKYHAAGDGFADAHFPEVQEKFLKDPNVAFAIAVDISGYLPTHNRRRNVADRPQDPAGHRSPPRPAPGAHRRAPPATRAPDRVVSPRTSPPIPGGDFDSTKR